MLNPLYKSLRGRHYQVAGECSIIVRTWTGCVIAVTPKIIFEHTKIHSFNTWRPTDLSLIRCGCHPSEGDGDRYFGSEFVILIIDRNNLLENSCSGMKGLVPSSCVLFKSLPTTAGHPGSQS